MSRGRPPQVWRVDCGTRVATAEGWWRWWLSHCGQSRCAGHCGPWARVQNFELRRGATMHSHTTTYIHRLTKEYSGLCSSVIAIFLGFGTKEYSSVVFLGTEEDTLFSYSVEPLLIFLALYIFLCTCRFFPKSFYFSANFTAISLHL
jgi:hypothetical protein